MQGLVNFTTAIADGISVSLPALCYLMVSVITRIDPGLLI